MRLRNKTLLFLMLALIASSLVGFSTCLADPHHIEGVNYCDVNQNGYIDEADTPLEGVCIRVESTDGGGVNERGCTDADGKYYIELPTIRPAEYKARMLWWSFPPDSIPIIPSTNHYLFSIVDGHVVEIFDWLIDSPACHSAALGDRVWEDLNANGKQDEDEPGIAGVTVNLFECGDDGLCGTDDDIPVDSTTTGPDGMYLFEDLLAGTYYVQFEKPTGYVFTSPNRGNDDARDSDADRATGFITSCVTLGPDEVNDTIDAGLFRLVTIGDLVWEDLDRDGIQDPDEPGIAGVTVKLFRCGPDGICGTADDMGRGETTTDANGEYLFNNRWPGAWCVTFEAPEGFSFTVKNAGNNPEEDSNANDDGTTDCIFVQSGETNLTIDAGLVECTLAVDKFCSVPVDPGPFVCDDAKPITSLSMVWNGASGVNVVTEGGQVFNDLQNGEKITFSVADLGNDVDVTITGPVSGESRFHVSCSDEEMNGPEDCGTNQGNGRDNDASRINDWLFAGMAGDLTLDCYPEPPVLAEQCEVFGVKRGSCNDGDPTALVFEYTGDNCSATTNDQEGRFVCEDTGSLGDLLDVVMTKDADKISVEIVGNTVKIFYTDPVGREFPSEIEYRIIGQDGEQTHKLHTSCSRPLNVGDQFGSLILKQFIPTGVTLPSENVVYIYRITNTGIIPVIVDVVDDKLGPIADGLEVPAEDTVELTESALLADPGTVTNIVTVTDVDDPECSATDEVTVNVLEPPATCDDGDPTALVFEYTGDSCSATTNDQEGSFECDETGPLGDLLNVVMTKDADKISVEIVGNMVRIFYTDPVGREFPSEIEYRIIGQDGEQTHKLHTSCSRPLNVGDQFGALNLWKFIPNY